MDAIDCGLVHSPNTLVLNLADIFPGGDVKGGLGAQEDNPYFGGLITIRHYGEAVYSPNVTVSKTSETTGWMVFDTLIRFRRCHLLRVRESNTQTHSL